MPGGDIWAIIAGGTVGTVMNEGCRKVNVMNRSVIEGDCCPNSIGGSCERPGQAIMRCQQHISPVLRRVEYATEQSHRNWNENINANKITD
jgi:hypothetical protein